MREQEFGTLKQILSFDKNVIVLLHYGEFGWFIIRHILLFHIVSSAKKVICCKRGEESFFPDADDFFYDFEDAWEYADKRGYKDLAKDKIDIISKIKMRYSNYKILDFGFSTINDVFHFDSEIKKIEPFIYENLYDILSTNVDFDLTPKLNYIKTDVVFGARKRKNAVTRNWKYWKGLGLLVNMESLTFSVVGLRDTTFNVERSKYYSWEFKNSNDAAIELIKNCKLFIGSDTGTAHLAAFLKKPIIIVSRINNKSSLLPLILKRSKKYNFKFIVAPFKKYFDINYFKKVLENIQNE